MYSQLAVVRLPFLLSSFSNFLFFDFLAVDLPKTHNPLLRNAAVGLEDFSAAQVKSLDLNGDVAQYQQNINKSSYIGLPQFVMLNFVTIREVYARVQALLAGKHFAVKIDYLNELFATFRDFLQVAKLK